MHVFKVLRRSLIIASLPAYLLGITPLRGQSGASRKANVEPASVATLIAAGRASLADGNTKAAELAYRHLIKSAPKLSEGHSGLGAVLLREGESAGSLRELDLAAQLATPAAPSGPGFLLELAAAHSLHRDYAKSVDAYRRYVATAEAARPEAGNRLPELAVALATALQQEGQADAARQILETGIAVAATRPGGALPQAARMEDALGAVLAQKNQESEAEVHLRRAVIEDPGFALAHFHLGALELGQADAAGAVQELRRAIEIDPAPVAYKLQLARSLLAAGQEADAETLMKELLLSRPGVAALAPADAVEARYQLALAEQAGGKSAEALPLLLAVVEARPTDMAALTNAGLAQMQMGHAPEAIALYQRATAVAPNDPTLRQDLGVAYLQQNDLAHALEQFRAGLAVEPDNPQLHYDLGLALKLKDDLAGAVPEFERAAALNPSLPDPPYTLGVIYMQQGRFADAAKSLEAHLALKPDNGDAWSTLGSVYRQMEQPEKAIAALEKAIALLPAQPSAHITLASILAARGDKEGAARERKLGADLTRVAVSRQKASFALDSGNLLLKRGQAAEALVQFRNAVEADPTYAAAHLALAEALERSGDPSGAQAERVRAAQPR